MKATTKWLQKMQLETEIEGHTLKLDAKSPIGESSAMTPKELLLPAVAGCTAMDVIALMKKHKQPMESFTIENEAQMSESGMPKVFTRMDVNFYMTGNVDPAKYKEAVELSQTKYCGVSKMLAPAFPIHYHIFLNGEKIGEGQGHF